MRVVVHVDGGARGNPGPAAVAAVATSADGERLGLGDGDVVEVSSNGTSVRARVALRERLHPGSAFLIEGTDVD